MSSSEAFSLRKDVTKRRRGYVQTEKILREHSITAQELRLQVGELLTEGLIAPTNSAETMYAGEPPLMSKYRIAQCEREPYDTAGLHERISKSPWVKKHPDRARDIDPFIRQLSLALSGQLDMTGLDKREAGYLLALDEHAFDGTTSYTRALSALHVELSDLGVIDVPWPPTMETYQHGDGTVIISENAGPYNHLRRIARSRETAVRSFGFAPSAVVFGAGNSVTRPGYIEDVLEQAYLPLGSRLLYWGDLDRAGIGMLCHVVGDGASHASAWVAPYHMMLEAARRRAPRDSADERGLTPDLTPLEKVLQPADMALARRLLERGSLVPQEAVPPHAYSDGSLSC